MWIPYFLLYLLLSPSANGLFNAHISNPSFHEEEVPSRLQAELKKNGLYGEVIGKVCDAGYECGHVLLGEITFPYSVSEVYLSSSNTVILAERLITFHSSLQDIHFNLSDVSHYTAGNVLQGFGKEFKTTLLNDHPLGKDTVVEVC